MGLKYVFNIFTKKPDLINESSNTGGYNPPIPQSDVSGLVTNLSNKEDSSNKSTSISDSTSTTKFPVWSIIVSYFDATRIRTLLGITTLSGSNTGDQIIPTTLPPSGTAGGDLSGSYPNPAILNSVVLAKLLTGLNISGSNILATDNLLQAFGKLQNQINGVLGGAIYQSTYNAATNTPTLSDGVGTKGYYYVVSVSGVQNFGSGNIDFKVGDWSIYNGTIWEKVDNTDAVSSVNGFLGAVNLTTANINEVTNLYFTASRAIASQLTGYISGAGTVLETDTILQAIQKLNGNILSLVSNATHTGDVTGATALTIDKTAITGKTTVTPVSGDFILISDTSDNGDLKKVDVSSFLGGAGGITRTIINQSTSTTAGFTVNTDYFYDCMSTFTLTLPTAVGNTNRYTIKNNGTGIITVNTTSSQTIDGGLTAIIPYQNYSIDLISDGANWMLV